MPAPQAFRFAARAAALLFGGRSREDSGHGGAGIIAAVALFLVAVIVAISSPLGAWALFLEGSGVQGGGRSYGLYDIGVDGERVSWYLDKERELREYAEDRWSSGEGDIYSTPDWRYLYAFDMALSENDFDLVVANEEYYDSLHKSLLTASPVTHTVLADADEGDDGAYWDDDRGKYVTARSRTSWTVNAKDMSSSFRRRVSADGVSEDFLYFIGFESGDWGAERGWGDQGNAIGALQFDRRAALDDFCAYAVNAHPGAYDYLAPFAGMGTIPQGDEGLLAAWRRAYAQDPDEWIRLQVAFEYERYYVPGEEALAGIGFDCSSRPDAIKGLVASLCNLNGVGGATRYFRMAGLDDSMSDEQVARALCGAIISSPPGPYPTAYANRYRAEQEIVLSLIADSSAAPGSEPARSLGDDPDAEGRALPLDLKGELAQNFRRSLYAVDMTVDEQGRITAEMNRERFEEIITDGKPVRGLDTATTEEGRRIVEACRTVDSPGQGLCAMWVSRVYAAAGCGTPVGNANDMWASYCTSTDPSELEPGMIIAVEHSSAYGEGYAYGHVGIYVGEVDGVPSVMDNVGRVRTISLEGWISENNYSGNVAWGWAK